YCFSHDAPTTNLYTLSLHDALPILTEVLVTAPFPEELIEKIRAVSPDIELEQIRLENGEWPADKVTNAEVYYAVSAVPHPEQARSEEHTSELQSRENLVCRLLLEKK